MRLWQFLRPKRQSGVKRRDDAPRSVNAAADKAAESWEKDGDRGDQDYFHVPGGENPDASDPVKLKGRDMPKEGAPGAPGRPASKPKKPRGPEA